MCLKSNPKTLHIQLKNIHSIDRFNIRKTNSYKFEWNIKTKCSVANGSNHNEENNHDEQRKLQMA